jgi:hypothetical protein
MPAPKVPARPLAPVAGEPTPAAAIGPADNAAIAALIPEPHSASGGEGPLSEQEAAELTACEQAILASQYAFVWITGKALAAISKGKLYRTKYARFEDYATEVWDISAQRAYQLIAAWPVAARLATVATIAMQRVNEGQLRALMPVVKGHGVDQAVMVFATVAEVAAEVDGAKVTAKVIGQVAGQLPAGHLERGDVADRARMIFTATTESDGTPPHPWAVARENAVRALRKMVSTSVDRADMLAAIVELHEMLDQMKAELIPDEASQAGAG